MGSIEKRIADLERKIDNIASRLDKLDAIESAVRALLVAQLMCEIKEPEAKSASNQQKKPQPEKKDAAEAASARKKGALTLTDKILERFDELFIEERRNFSFDDIRIIQETRVSLENSLSRGRDLHCNIPINIRMYLYRRAREIIDHNALMLSCGRNCRFVKAMLDYLDVKLRGFTKL